MLLLPALRLLDSIQPMGDWELRLIIKELNKEDIDRIREIDRAEKVKLLYRCKDGSLIPEKVDLNVPRWSKQEYAKRISTLSRELSKGGTLIGAIDGNVLVGAAILGHKLIGENLDEFQLVFLHVSIGYRRKGIATKLFNLICKLAKDKGARQLYISSTPSESAVGFYLSHGCKLATKVNKELYQLEPEDIHIVKEL